MEKIELLSPAGDMKSLIMAVKCGADAVYISGINYGARKYAENFTIEEIEKAIKYCHLYGVKLYVTVNTIIEELEIKDVYNYVKKLHEMGVDAIIVQDIGLINYLHKRLPNLEIHASTQCHNVNSYALSFLKDLGVKRAVLARELTIEEIEKLDKSIEIEVFIHGALCVSYSGQCYISSHLFGRSGNKGECAQVCRFCFSMFKDNKKVSLKDDYLLSMKELNLGENIAKLIELGVNSLKIEGRMKSPYYVGYTTKIYRMLIDKYYNGEKLEINEEEYNNLLTLYNREFTKGFLFSDDVINTKTCNHQGSLLGQVLEVNKKVKILLYNDLNQEDGVRFSNNEGMICNYIYDEKDLLINKASKGDIIYLDNKINLKSKGYVYKTLDVSLHRELDKMSNKSIPVDFYVNARVGHKLSIKIVCDDIDITKSMNIVEEAINKKVAKEDIKSKLSKLGNTPFTLNNIYYDMDDNIFVPIKDVNNLRRELVSSLINLRENNKGEITEKEYFNDVKKNVITNEISFLVRNENQLKILIDKDVNIYVEDYKLYKKYMSNKIFYRNSRSAFIYESSVNSLISDNGGFKYYLDKDRNVTDIYMNVKNSLSLGIYSNYSYKVGLSFELDDNQVKEVMEGYIERFGFSPNVEILIYGKLELMLTKYCPIKYLLNDKSSCNCCFNNKYYLSDKRNNKYMLLKDNLHNIRVMSSDNIDKINNIDYYRRIGITNFRIDLSDEDEKSVKEILKRLNI